MVKTLHVFVYDDAAPHTATISQFSVADGTLSQNMNPGTENEWLTTKAIKTKKADKRVFVGVNLTPAIVNEITSIGFGAFNQRDFAQTVAELTDGTNGFVMFNDSYPAVTPSTSLSDDETAANASHLKISVDRVVAKATVSKGSSFTVGGGGTMTDLQYGWRNINKRFYFVQYKDGGVVKDHNWDSFTTNDFHTGADALAVNENGTTPNVFSYATENAVRFTSGSTLVDEVTYLSISGKFTPTNVVAVKGGVGTPATGADFETVTNPNPAGSTFYVVRTDDGVANYFAEGTVAEQFAQLAIDGAAGMPVLTEPYVLAENTYTGGTCYYHVFVNADGTAPYGPYGIYRNQYYKVTVNTIQAPGSPSDNFDNGEEVKDNAWIGVDVSINPWTVIDEEHDI